MKTPLGPSLGWQIDDSLHTHFSVLPLQESDCVRIDSIGILVLNMCTNSSKVLKKKKKVEPSLQHGLDSVTRF